MNERQRDLFLFLWSKRRTPGLRTVGLRGLGIGALGGILFGLMRVFASQEAMYKSMLAAGARVPRGLSSH
jgi:hypothetical protein